MFKHILAPTDGSASSELALQSIMRFARSIGARVTGVTVVKAGAADDAPAMQQARASLLSVEQYAGEFAVPCATLVARGDPIHAAIVQAAYDRQCDLIAMAARGRSGVQGAGPASETREVLAHMPLPVLVFQ